MAPTTWQMPKKTKSSIGKLFHLLSVWLAQYFLLVFILSFPNNLFSTFFFSDLKPENILVYVLGCTPGHKPDWKLLPTSNMVVKLGDFGLGRSLPPEEASKQYNTTGVGTIKYMAPEVKQSGKYGVEADIWSFGFIMHELATGKVPEGGLKKVAL